MSHFAGSGFWAELTERFGNRDMLLDTAGQRWSYRVCAEAISHFAEHLRKKMPAKKGVCALLCRNTPDTVVAYLACLQAGQVVMLLHPEMSDSAIRDLCHRYRVNLLIRYSDSLDLFPDCTHLSDEVSTVHPELAVLLSTSGSSGSPKQVRLSYQNLQANAESIARYLVMRSTDRALVHLPLHYSYGLSVLNSHLLVGASCVLHDGSVLERTFWNALKTLSVTNLAGVPFTYELLERLRFDPSTYPDLAYMTQAGGKLPPEKVKNLARQLSLAGKQFYVMYGQTEATARMSYLPADLCEIHPESIGQPIPGGQFELWDEQGERIHGANQVGQLVYRGDNVMLGYALDYRDLAAGPALSCLQTGDLAWRDEQGLYYLQGRQDRVRKVLGNRLDLDELQSALQAHFGPLACVASDRYLQVFFENKADADKLSVYLAQQVKLPASSILLTQVGHLPRTPTGKLDYLALEKEGVA